MKTPYRLLLLSMVLATGCMPTDPTGVLGPAGKLPDGTTPTTPTTPTNPDGTPITPTQGLTGTIACENYYNNVTLTGGTVTGTTSTLPTVATTACGTAAGAAHQYAFQSPSALLVEIELHDNDNLTTTAVVAPNGTTTACLDTGTAGESAVFGANPNTQYVVVVTMANNLPITTSYDLEVNCFD